MSLAGDIFSRALEQPRGRRQRFIDRCTGTDRVLRAEIESLLQAHEKIGDFLAATDGGAREPSSAAEPSPDAVPGHELLRKLGEGGCGTVYLALETGELRRPVAIKFLKSHLISPASLERFASERQILANLQHDGIARIYRAGTANAGCPYYTMEWVDGLPLDEHCNAGRLTIRARVQLFLRVACAVAHAHQRGVIHGDLKPRNVLVCKVDGNPSPKVIDFGVARFVDEGLLDDDGPPIGTPHYMGPEQLQGRPADTRSDVFALGAMLHELLCGRSPDGARDASTRSDLRSLSREDLARLAEERSTSVGSLRRAVNGDLDWIVGMATRTAPDDRYGGVGQLIADLESWLASMPLPSRPRTVGYVISRFLARSRVPFFAALLVPAMPADDEAAERAVGAPGARILATSDEVRPAPRCRG